MANKQSVFIDYFRIVAALLVFLGHGFSFFGISIFKDDNYFFSIQQIGVVMLFLLAGYLNAFSLCRNNIENKYSLKKYVSRRIKRIYVEYLMGIICIAIIDYILIKINSSGYKYHTSYDLWHFIINLLMLQNTSINFLDPNVNIITFGSGRPLWTMAVEWWLGLLFSYVYIVISNKEKITFKKSICLIVFLILPIDYYVGGRCGGLGLVYALGFLSYFIIDKIEKNVAQLGVVLSAVAFIVIGITDKRATTIYVFCIIWCYFMCQMRVLDSECPQFNNRRILCFCSGCTFELYLIHYSVMNCIKNCDSDISNIWRLMTSIVISCFLSVVLYKASRIAKKIDSI